MGVRGAIGRPLSAESAGLDRCATIRCRRVLGDSYLRRDLRQIDPPSTGGAGSDRPGRLGNPAVKSSPHSTKPAAVNATVRADELSASADAAAIRLPPGCARSWTIALPPLVRTALAMAFCSAGGSPGTVRRRALTREPSVVTRIVPRIAIPSAEPTLPEGALDPGALAAGVNGDVGEDDAGELRGGEADADPVDEQPRDDLPDRQG
jgi:hypothetical protein